MFCQTDNEDTNPLLSPEHSLFSIVDDDDDLDATSALDPDHNALKHDQVHVISQPLRSTISSREAGMYVLHLYWTSLIIYTSKEYDLDPDDLDDDTSLRQLENTHVTPNDQSMPLLVGLIDSSARRSMDVSLPLNQHNGHGSREDEIDLDALASKRTSGGGLLNSTANMANSILGAGEHFSLLSFLVTPHIHNRKG